MPNPDSSFPPRPVSTKTGPMKVLNTVSILDAVRDGRELSAVEALHLLQLNREDELSMLRQAADEVRQRQVGDAVSYQASCSLYLTNFCELAPVLYDYPKTSGDERGYILTIDGIDEILERAVAQSVSRLYVSGGGFWSILQIPGLEAPTGLKTYAKLLSYLREKAPGMVISGLSPDEVDFLSIIGNRNETYVLELLQDAGLSILGGQGAEILVDAVRQRISPKKASVKRWFEIAQSARKAGLLVQARLEAGPLETLQQRVSHLERLRHVLQQEDNSGATPFMEFFPQMWTRLPALFNTPDAPRPQVRPEDRLKLTAVTRLFLGDWLPNQQVFWQPNGSNEAQDALQWGANALGGTDALAHLSFLSGVHPLRLVQEYSPEDLKRLIEEAGRQPLLRTLEP